VIEAGALSAELIMLQPQQQLDPPSIEARYSFESQEAYDAWGRSFSLAAFVFVLHLCQQHIALLPPSFANNHSLLALQICLQSRTEASRRR
jgi:hypothetical protein